ncbi:hypothetical protein Hanom_Chr17g01569151 [Helianthus anomalus]
MHGAIAGIILCIKYKATSTIILQITINQQKFQIKSKISHYKNTCTGFKSTINIIFKRVFFYLIHNPKNLYQLSSKTYPTISSVSSPSAPPFSPAKDGLRNFATKTHNLYTSSKFVKNPSEAVTTSALTNPPLFPSLFIGLQTVVSARSIAARFCFVLCIILA